MRDAVILDAVRTPIGRYAGVLSPVRPDDLAARTITAAVERNGLDPAKVDEVYMGCTNQAGEDNRNVARMASLICRAACGGARCDGQPALRLGPRGDRPGRAPGAARRGGVRARRGRRVDVPRAARDAEARTRLPRGNSELVDTTIGWRFINPSLAERHPTESMGETAENVAERYEVAREDQDAFALESHRRAVAAAEAGRFDDELVTVDVPQPKGDPVTIHADEGPRPDTSLERLARLRPIFRDGGTVTAGNASQINDGAACVVVTSEERASELGREPLARLVSSASAGVDPAYMGIGPVPASRKALERAGLEPKDIDLVELNEAFASQVLASMRELGFDHDRLNVNGGAIALGHPLGASGARLLGTLAWELRRRGARYGLATMCIGVGQGLAAVIENPAAR